MVLRNGRIWKSGLLGAVVVAVPGLWVFSQEMDPFAPAKPATPAAPAASPQAAPTVAPDETHPVVLSVRASNPSDPVAWLRATRMMVDIRRYDEAATYLDPLLAAPLEDAAAFSLLRQEGTAFLLELTSIEPLAEKGRALRDKIVPAAARYARSPERVAPLLDQLDAPSIQDRTEALQELRALGADGIVAVMNRLLTAPVEQRAVYIDTLQAWGSAVDSALLAALQSDDATVRTAVAEVLGRRQVLDAIPWLMPLIHAEGASDEERAAATAAAEILIGRVPSREEAIQRVFQAWRNRTVLGDPTESTESWTWEKDSGVGRPVLSNRAASEAVEVERAQLAEALVDLDPQHPEFQIAAWTGRLVRAQLTRADETPLSSSAVSSETPSTEMLEGILQASLSLPRPLAGIAAADLLGELGTETLLQNASGQPSALAEALHHSDRRLRFAAVRAILQLNPTSSFAGANRVIPTLCWFARGTGMPRVAIGHPVRAGISDLTGALADLGIAAEGATRGRELFELAVSHPDFEAIFVSDVLSAPECLELVQQLRRDPRTAEVPIVLLARPETMERARRIAAEETRMVAQPWPATAEFVRLGLDELEAVAEGRVIPGDERARQAQAAMAMLETIVDRPQVFAFEDLYAQESLLIELTTSGSVGAEVLRIVAALATPQAQQSLVDLIGNTLLSMEVREAAADAFSQAVERRGLLLTTHEIQRAYDRRNAAAEEDPRSQAVLDRMLDIIERPSGLSSRSNP